MNQLKKFSRRVNLHLFLVLFLTGLAVTVAWWFGYEKMHYSPLVVGAELISTALIISIIVSYLSTRYLIKPFALIRQAIEHISPEGGQVASPNIASNQLGHELVTTLISQVYALATNAENISSRIKQNAADFHSNSVASNLPLPMLIVDAQQNITFASIMTMKVFGISEADIVGKNIYSVLDMSFETDQTFDKWLQSARANTVNDAHSWERVRVNLYGDAKKMQQFDMAAYYNKATNTGYEVLLVLFDHTTKYSHEDEGLSFIALAVHELRTPLTLLRGYIEALEEDIGASLSPSDAEFLRRMDAAGQQLATFMNNVLNVARIEDDQFVVHISEENWADIIQSAVSDMSLRSKIEGIDILAEIEPNLPTVGVDKVSVYEVLSNLIDNAIKYSGNSKKIMVRSKLSQDGLVETSVEDFGVGISENIVPNLFDKFYRNHRTRQQIGGTGLGLYLSKAIINAQGGNIWVRSKEGKGSVFSFTVVPYSQIPTLSKTNGSEMTHTVHGWIKNHSLYRR